MKGDVVLHHERARIIYRQYPKRLPMFVVTANPTDYPTQFVARLQFTFPTIEPTRCVMVRDTLEELRSVIPPECACLTRMPDDDPSIVEVWV